MSVKQAVLGLVIERPGYGYELVQRFEERIGGWRPSQTAVYPALLRLHASGAVQKRVESSSHRNVTWYEATDHGREEFRSWMCTPPVLMPMRDDMYIKIAFACPEDLELLIAQTREQEQLCLDRIDRLTGAGVGAEVLMHADVEWRAIGQAWLLRTELSQLATTIESLQEARKLMKDAVRRERDADDRGRRG
ncbi:PadR family transcriptional regulator [Conexibacter woesei]|uniref:Transcriptional regulator, PadR-like family n=1 Tax=Conexibacter woesei (strain DSM 14684 / CCUG 47730 / CIP 108061 / JCM 11494 / NBRC 100937 / ID131577) TaxID=469383 RepID=D3F0U4_CONWI|nr:PadR family transcriptional regulator [Conexibacter woesei]ADB54028.1 transcriptional regulator, PadR-like family [Conexibacter woesei DSM 14684]